MAQARHNLLVVLGPTASGKTRLGARLARDLGGEVVSADSRQVYRGLDIGSGKDLDEYTVVGEAVPYHLIDIVDLDTEFNVYEYQTRFFELFEKLGARGVTPVLVGGTGLYIQAALSAHRMIEVPENPELRIDLAGLSMEALQDRLRGLSDRLHNTTDLVDRDRLVRAIEIAAFSAGREPEPAPDIRPLILGTAWPRGLLRKRIARRLRERMDAGLVKEVEGLLARGVPAERLKLLGLEYRYVAQFIDGEFNNRNDMVQKLSSAICQFAKRQETWFRRMERRGAEIHWVERADYSKACEAVQRHLGA